MEHWQKSGIIPDWTSFIPDGTANYKKWIYDTKSILGDEVFSCWGYFIEGLLRKMISNARPELVNWGPTDDKTEIEASRDPERSWKGIVYDLYINACVRGSSLAMRLAQTLTPSHISCLYFASLSWLPQSQHGDVSDARNNPSGPVSRAGSGNNH